MPVHDAGDELDLGGPGPVPSDAEPDPTGGGATPWRTRADVVEFLRRLAHGAGLEVPRATVETAVVDLLSDVAERDLARRLSRACGRLGVRLRSLRSDVGAAVASSGSGRPVVLVGRRRGRLELMSIFGGTESPLVSADVLTERDLKAVESSPGHVASRLHLDEVRIVAAFRAESVTGEEPREESAPKPSSLRRLWRFVAPDRTEILIVAWAAVGLGILTLSTPIAVQSLVNFVAFGGLMQPLFVVGLLLLFFLAFAGAVRVFKLYVVEILQRRVFVRVVMALAARLPRVRTERWDRGYGPEVINRFFDVLTVQKAGSSLLISGLDAVLQSGIGLVVLGFYHPLLLLFDVLLIAAILFIVFGLGRGGVASARVESKAKYAVAAALEDMARIPMTYKLFGGPNYARARLAELCSHYIGTRRQHYSVVMRQIIGAVSLYAIASTALLTLGGFLVIKGQLTLGQLVAAELIVSLALVTFVKFGKEFETFYDLLAGVDKLGVLFDLPLEEDGDEPYLARGGGAALECRGVSYRGASTTGVESLDLRIRANERVVLRGARGSGKSTLADLLAGLRTPDAGIVLIDGMDVRGVLKATLRSNLAVVKGIDIVAGTILDNIRLSRSDISASAVRSVLRDLGILDEILALRGGLRTELSSTGAPLSERTAELLVLARAAVGRPRILIVDGVLDDLDGDSLRSAAEVLTDRRAPWTLIVLTSREEVSAALDADRVVVLGGGAEPLPADTGETSRAGGRR